MKTPTADRQTKPRLLFHLSAYTFVREALNTAQEEVSRRIVQERLEDETHHITGPELLEGVRILGLRRYGPMAPVVFRYWGLQTTDDFGRLVFEMIERGEMRKSDTDQLADFNGVYLLDDSFSIDYKVDVSKAFRTL
jgi:uncharacterized repeat protein (TIGR04138 family)